MNHKLLVNTTNLPCSSDLANIIGDKLAQFLQQIHYSCLTNKERNQIYFYKEDDWWVRKSVKEWHKRFTTWSEPTIARIIFALEKMGLIEINAFDKPLGMCHRYYRVNYKALNKLLNCNKELYRLKFCDRIKAVQNWLNSYEEPPDKKVANDRALISKRSNPDIKEIEPCDQKDQTLRSKRSDPAIKEIEPCDHFDQTYIRNKDKYKDRSKDRSNLSENFSLNNSVPLTSELVDSTDNSLSLTKSKEEDINSAGDRQVFDVRCWQTKASDRLKDYQENRPSTVSSSQSTNGDRQKSAIKSSEDSRISDQDFLNWKVQQLETYYQKKGEPKSKPTLSAIAKNIWRKDREKLQGDWQDWQRIYHKEEYQVHQAVVQMPTAQMDIVSSGDREASTVRSRVSDYRRSCSSQSTKEMPVPEKSSGKQESLNVEESQAMLKSEAKSLNIQEILDLKAEISALEAELFGVNHEKDRVMPIKGKEVIITSPEGKLYQKAQKLKKRRKIKKKNGFGSIEPEKKSLLSELSVKDGVPSEKLANYWNSSVLHVQRKLTELKRQKKTWTNEQTSYFLKVCFTKMLLLFAREDMALNEAEQSWALSKVPPSCKEVLQNHFLSHEDLIKDEDMYLSYLNNLIL